MKYELVVECWLGPPHPLIPHCVLIVRIVSHQGGDGEMVCHMADNTIYAEARRIVLHVYCHLAVVNAVRCNVVESQSGYQICYRTYINVVKVHYTPILNKRF